MRILGVVWYVIAALLLGAHFLRAGNVLLVVLCLAMPLLFLWRARWSLILLQIAAYVAATTWLVAAARLVAMRQSLGEPWTLAAAILGGVALLTLVAGLMLNSRAMKARHAPGESSASRDS